MLVCSVLLCGGEMTMLVLEVQWLIQDPYVNYCRVSVSPVAIHERCHTSGGTYSQLMLITNFCVDMLIFQSLRNCSYCRYTVAIQLGIRSLLCIDAC